MVSRNAAPTNGKKRKHRDLENVTATDLPTSCLGCKRRSYPHGRKFEQTSAIICNKCKKGWHGWCMTRKGVQRPNALGWWKCPNCGENGKPFISAETRQATQVDNLSNDHIHEINNDLHDMSAEGNNQPIYPIHNKSGKSTISDAGLEINSQSHRDHQENLAAYTETLLGDLSPDMNTGDSRVLDFKIPKVPEVNGDLLKFEKKALTQAQNAYKEAKILLESTVQERKNCRAHFYTLKNQMYSYSFELEELKKQEQADETSTNDEGSKHSVRQALALEIGCDSDWAESLSAEIDLSLAREKQLTEHKKSLQEVLATRRLELDKFVELGSRYSAYVDSSYETIEKLRSKVTVDFEEESDDDGSNSVCEILVDLLTSDLANNLTKQSIDLRTPRDENDSMDSAALNISSCEVVQGPEAFSQALRQDHMQTLPANVNESSETSHQEESSEEMAGKTSHQEENSDKLATVPSPSSLTIARGQNALQAQPLISLEEPRTMALVREFQPLQVLTPPSSSPGSGYQHRDQPMVVPHIFETAQAAQSEAAGDMNQEEALPQPSEILSSAKVTQESEVLRANSEMTHRYNQFRIGLGDCLSVGSNTASQISPGLDVAEEHQRRKIPEVTGSEQSSEQGGSQQDSRRQFAPWYTSAVTPTVSTPSDDAAGHASTRSSDSSQGSVQAAVLNLTYGSSCSEAIATSTRLEEMARFAQSLYVANAPVEQQPVYQALSEKNQPIQIDTKQTKVVTRHLSAPAPQSINLPSPAHLGIAPWSFSTPPPPLIQHVSPRFIPYRHTSGNHMKSGILQTSVTGTPALAIEVPRKVYTEHFSTASPSFRKRLCYSLTHEEDGIEVVTKVGTIYRQDLRTLVPSREHLNDNIINEYLHCLRQHTNARRQSGPSISHVAMIGSNDNISTGLLSRLAAFSIIFIPIKVQPTQWTLAVLYPSMGRAELYDSHAHWSNNSMGARSSVHEFLEFRLGEEFKRADWAVDGQQWSQPQSDMADSGLYVLANAKSIALDLVMVRLNSSAKSKALMWQVARELVSGCIVEAF